MIELRTIVGSVDRTADFDRRFRPTSNRLRERWQGINLAQRSGRGVPPITVYRVGDLHFVRDGHHRVSVALALGHTVIEANVTEVLTQIPAAGISDRGDLVVKGYERLFRQRVPLPDERPRASSATTRGTTRSCPRTSRRGRSGSSRTQAST